MNEQLGIITHRLRNLPLSRWVQDISPQIFAKSHILTPFNQVISMIKGLQEQMANMDKVLTDSIRCCVLTPSCQFSLQFIHFRSTGVASMQNSRTLSSWTFVTFSVER